MKCPTADMVLSVFVLLLCCLCLVVRGEFFTSISELETLLQTEGEVAKTIDNYVRVEKRRLEKIRRLGKEYHKMYDSAIGNAEAFLSHPVHAFLLIKHLTATWEEVALLMEEAKDKISDVIETLSIKGLNFPGKEDLTGASLALIRLQETYLLNTTKIANGELAGTTNSWPLSGGDCFILGHQAFLEEDHKYSVLWMQEALKKMENESMPTVNRHAIMEQITLSNFILGKAKEAKQVAQKILEEDPNHLPASRYIEVFDQYIRDDEAGLISDIDKEKRSKGFRFHKDAVSHYEKYEKLCRGERFQKLKEQRQLHCRYSSQNNSFLLLQPVKEELLSLNPRIVMYHDVISDQDADILKKLALPKLKRARVQSTETGFSQVTRSRVSKSATLDDSYHPVIAKASRMTQAITGLAVSSAEDLHIVNYGIGGFYQPHYDYSIGGVPEVFASLGIGNRIATWIYYLSDVEAGGYTVFPSIGVQVKPRKGSAAFWFNLKRSGDGDLKTMHAACPVLIGSKWVANKWFHETDNEFRRKCSLSREE